MASELLPTLVNYVALVYHEARNVRHLVSNGYLPRDGWDRLISLPRSREEAWRDIQPLIAKAAKASGAAKALDLFRRRLGVSLEDLVGLYCNSSWRNAPDYGGSACHLPLPALWAVVYRIPCFLLPSKCLETRIVSQVSETSGPWLDPRPIVASPLDLI